MVKTISKVGNSHGLIFDSALLELARLKAGDEVNVEVHAGGTITITPLRSQPSGEEVTRVIKKTMKDYARHHEEALVTPADRDWFHLSVDQVQEIHAEALKRFGGLDGVREQALLESAVAAPKATFGGESLYTTIVEVAAGVSVLPLPEPPVSGR